MDREHVLRQINAIFENCKQHMENTEADWEKAYGAFSKLLKDMIVIHGSISRFRKLF